MPVDVQKPVATASVPTQDEFDIALARLTALETAQAATDTTLAALTGRVDAAEVAATALDTRLTAAEAAAAALDPRVTAAETTVAALDTRLATAEAAAIALDARVAAAEAADAALDARLDAAESGLADHAPRLTAAESTLTDHAARLVGAEAAAAALDTRMDTAETALADLNGSVSSLNNGVSSLNSGVAALDTRLDAVEAADATLDTRLAATEAADAALDVRLDAAETALTALDARVDALEEATPGAATRPYGPLAPWNVPVANLPLDPNTTSLTGFMYNSCPNVAGNFNCSFVDYTYPVYYTTDATETRIVAASGGSANWNGQSVPFHPSWVAAPGSDAQMIILDPVTGTEWNFFAVTAINATTITCVRCNRITVNDDGTGGVANYMTKESGFQPSRGIGIQYLAMVVRPEEVAAGVIDHALSMPVKNTHCTVSVAPATKTEGSAACIANGMPIGTRFALAMTVDEIDAWVATLPAALPAGQKTLARIVAKALRDYGWFVTDTAGAAHFQFEARVSAAAKWDALGIAPTTVNGKSYPQDLLDGLITQARLRAFVPSDQYPAQYRTSQT